MAGPAAGGASSVLILDDDVELSEVLRIRLERDGFTVITAHSMSRFEESLGEARPCAVLVDLNLGSQDGLQAAERLCALGYGGPVFLISGSDDRVLTAARRHAEALGLDMPAVFRKPFSPAELSSAILSAVAAPRVAGASDLLRGLQGDQIRPFFQPQVDLVTGALVGAEALARWALPDGSVEATGRFLPIVEAEGLWGELTDAIMRGVAKAMDRWRGAGLTPCRISINLEASVATDPDFGPRAAALADDLGIPHGLIGFEITEQTAMGDSATALRALTWLRIKGFDLSIDDFGTGFSSLAVLHAMPFSELKIDKSFVRRLVTDADAQVIVKAIVDLAHNLGLVCVAEGIEDQATLDQLRAMGCDRGQGFIFGGAVDAASFAGHLTAGFLAPPASPTAV